MNWNEKKLLAARQRVCRPRTHLGAYVGATICWLERVSGHPDRSLPDRWGTEPGMTDWIWTSHLTALALAQRRKRPVLLVTTWASEFESARRLLLEPLGYRPCDFARLECHFWAQSVMERAMDLECSPLHLWHPDDMERTRGDAFGMALHLACLRAGASTVVIDDHRRLPALRRHRRHPLVHLEDWSKRWRIEIIVRYEPAEPKINAPEA